MAQSVEHGLLVCTTTIAIGNGFIHKGQIARAGHPVTKKYPNAFEPLKVDFEHSEPTSSRHAAKTGPLPKAKPSIKFVDPPKK